MRIVTLTFLLTAICHLLSAQSWTPLLDPARRDLLHEALSGEIAKDHVIQITRHHRIQGSRGFRDAAQYVLGRLRAYGFDERDALIESYPSDGRAVYQTWQSPSGWDVASAELRMIEPYEERIVGYPEIAMSLITYSNAGEATAELVWVGAGTRDADYEGKDVRGKFVLATGYGGSVHRLAVLKYGAAGVVCFLDDDRAREYPDMLQYTGMWPRTDELERVAFGFNSPTARGPGCVTSWSRGARSWCAARCGERGWSRSSSTSWSPPSRAPTRRRASWCSAPTSTTRRSPLTTTPRAPEPSSTSPAPCAS
jgi:hypothetical protein